MSGRPAYPRIFVLPSTNQLWCTVWCTLFSAPNSGAHSWCMVELGAAFRPSQARPKSTPSVFLILSRAASPHSQTFSTHVSLNPPPTPIPDFFIHELAAGSHDHMSALHGVAASLHLHFMLGFNVRSHMPAAGCIINRIGCKYFPAQSCALPLLFFVYLHTFLLFTTLG